jgi:hypothetical protein
VVVVLACAAALTLVAIATSVAVGPVWVLLFLSALWLPANNHSFEGPVLLTVSTNHGITASDLGGITGFLVATGILVRRIASASRSERPVGPGAVLVYCCVVFGLGAAAAWGLG